MQPTGPKTLRVLAIILASLGGLFFLANTLVAMVFGVFDVPGRMERAMERDGVPAPHAAFEMMQLLVPVAAITALLSLLLCVGSLFLLQFRQWARLLVCGVLALMIAGVWSLPFLMQPYLEETARAMRSAGMPGQLPIGRLMLASQVVKAFVYSLPLAAALFLFARRSTGLLFRRRGAF